MIAFDEFLFQLINQEWHNSLLDSVLPIWRNKLFWLPLYVFIASFLLINFKKKGFFLILALAATIGISDTVSSKWIKKTVQRPRPCHEAAFKPETRLLVHCGSGYSFTSSHATNHFAMAFFLIFTLGKIIKRIKLPLFLWAFSIGYAQIYVGVHYPFDVLVGAGIGALIGYFVAMIFGKWIVIDDL